MLFDSSWYLWLLRKKEIAEEEGEGEVEETEEEANNLLRFRWFDPNQDPEDDPNIPL